MYLVFPNKIEFCTDQSVKSSFTIEPMILDSTLIAIPTCPICLEKMDINSSGIHTLSIPMSKKIKDRWKNCQITCNVCTNLNVVNLNNENSIKTKCSLCDVNELIWCCLICGFLGCGRYKNEHAVVHYEETFHRYSMDIVNYRIWDYSEDNYVHRMIKMDPSSNLSNLNDDQIYSLENDSQEGHTQNTISSKEFLTRIENIVSECDTVLASQLEEQRKYYEKELLKIETTNEESMKTLKQNLSNVNEELAKVTETIDNSKKLAKEYSKKLMTFDKQKEELISTISLNTELNKTLLKEIENMKEDEVK